MADTTQIRAAKERKKREQAIISLYCLGARGIEIQDTGRVCHVSAEVYTLTIRALVKTEEKESGGKEKREGSNLISSALKGRVLAPVSDSPR